MGLYHASKWALEAINQSLAQEVAGFGIKVPLIEPAGYTTDWSGPSARHSDEIAAYDPIRAQRAEMAKSRTKGNPSATAEAVLQVVDADDPPLRFLLGSDGLPIIRKAVGYATHHAAGQTDLVGEFSFEAEWRRIAGID